MNDDKHWLERPETIRKLWWGGCTILALLVIADFFYEAHPHFGFDGWPGFFAGFGLFACVAMILLAKALGLWVKRPDGFYTGGDEGEG